MAKKKPQDDQQQAQPETPKGSTRGRKKERDTRAVLARIDVDLADRLNAYIESLSPRPPMNRVVEEAIRQYLDRVEGSQST